MKQAATYDVAEMAKLLGTHRNTVRRWLKDGLQPLDDVRPIVVHGSELKAFLTKRRKARRNACAPDEFFCFRCRAPRRAAAGMVDVRHRTATVAALTGLCATCGTPMHRTVRRTALPALAESYDLQTLAPERLNGCTAPSLNGDLKGE
ncbi:helix-turn-helix domain-containing protein [Ancylobacter aquaticus]|uniref:helix-turn-helix domain-containing protein n=1 Tax=Ancylobacter aquaticus TaxID=100 RepID=UPI001405099E|nr:helix-turn-helix domain-containing protein [Ancylobacter aquaticus]